ncbi:retinol dehydrogenase 11 isoform X1 [Amyelois transitella]|uniref:retinol dehydrogenase 11 isoform X1 n=2 Tax=Amyelois transitella TaxID=680683 RepID=UPI0029904FAD|nr:retinol dehydrogenase 11 isoform X1 [Amyelois transitella]
MIIREFLKTIIIIILHASLSKIRGKMDCVSGWCKSKRRLDGQTAIVTGSNTGIGKETASDFYARGARVIMACRDTNKAEAAKKEIETERQSETNLGTLIVEKLDVSSLKSVREFVGRILESEPNINILVNNAGIMYTPEGKTEDGFELQIGTNHFGHALLTLLLLPRLIKSGPSRVVCVSSLLHKDVREFDFDNLNFEKTPYDPKIAYANSKAANVLFAKGLAIKLKEMNIDNVTTYSLHPGVIRTDIGRNFNQTVGFGATFAFNYMMGPFLKSVKCGAQTSIFCAVDETCAEQSGLYYSDCAVKQPSKLCQDEDLATRFLDHTVKVLNLSNYKAFGESDPPKEILG